MRRKILFLSAAVALAISTASPLQAALSFTQLNLNGNFRLQGSADITGFPLGNQTYLGGVPFTQNNLQGQVWNASYQANGSTPSSGNQVLTLSANVPDARGFYSIINTWWGASGPTSYASVTFNFSDNSSFSKSLVGNVDIRDFNYTGFYTTQINNTSTRNVYLRSVGAGNPYALDRQWFDFGAYSGKTLTGVTFTDTGAWNFQRFLVSGATVQSGFSGQIVAPPLGPGQTGGPGVPDSAAVPEPGQVAASLVLLAGIGGYVVMKRRRAVKQAA